MNKLINIENFGIVHENVRYATRKQILDFYQVPKSTLADNIRDLKKDGLVSGTEFRPTATDGKKYTTEVYTIDEVIAIGLRLRSDNAIMLQRMAIHSLKKELESANEKKRMLELELSHVWNRIDTEDLYQ